MRPFAEPAGVPAVESKLQLLHGRRNTHSLGFNMPLLGDSAEAIAATAAPGVDKCS